MELNGHIYSKTQFPEYKFRAKVRFTTVEDEHPLDIYTTDDNRQRTWQVLADRRADIVTGVTIIHWATKEQDELTSQMLEELFAENI